MEPAVADHDDQRRQSTAKFECPKCGNWFSRVTESRAEHDGFKRKRACVTCGKVFFTIERAA